MITKTKGDERRMRIHFQNLFANGELKEENFIFYVRHMWNEEAEKIIKNKEVKKEDGRENI